MASGRQHDRATWLLSLPFGLLWGPWLGLTGIVCAGLGFLLGGLLLSPDLDTHSNPTRRWGPLRLLWWPYRRLISHRSVFSHAPLLGSGLRLAYLLAVLLILSAVLHPWGAPSPQSVLHRIDLLWNQHRPPMVAALVGLEASCWLHLIQDGDPMPRLPKMGR